MKFSKEHLEAVNRRRRVILNYDALAGMMPFLEGEDLIQSMFGSADLPGSSIDSIFWNWGEGNHTMYKSEVVECFTHARFERFLQDGFDPVGLTLAESKRRGIETFFSYRINGSDADYWNQRTNRNEPKMPQFKKDNPDCLIYGTNHEVSPPYDFSKAKVRAHKIERLAEVFELYDYDGIEIDFARACPVLPPGKQWELRGHITEFMKMLRYMLQEKAAKRKHPILVAARVPETIAGCHFDGFDVENWVDAKIVDILIIGVRSYEVESRAFLDIVRDKPVKCYPCIDDIHATDGYRNPTLDVFRGVFLNWKHQGFEGFQTFNFQNSDPHVVGIRETMDKWLASQWIIHKRVYEELRQAEDGSYRYEDDDVERTYVIQRRGGGGHAPGIDSHPWDWDTPRLSYFNTNMESQLPAKLDYKPSIDTLLHIYVGENPDRAYPGALFVELSNPEDIVVRLNNAVLELDSQVKGRLGYAIGVNQLAEGDNLIGISLAHSVVDCRAWIERVEITL